MSLSSCLDVSAEVSAALKNGEPVVALESTIISHGMPYPENVESARTSEATIRAATMCAEGCIAVMHGERWPAVANPEAYNHPRWMR